MRNQEKYKNRNWRGANPKRKKLYKMNNHEQIIFAAMKFRVKECEAKIWLVKTVRVKKGKRLLQR